MEATFTEKGLLCPPPSPLLPTNPEKREKNGKLPRGIQRRCQGNKRAGHSHQLPGDRVSTDSPLCHVPRATVPPAGFVCGETKAAPVKEEWLGHLIGGSGSCFHTKRDAQRPLPGGPQPFSSIRWGQLRQTRPPTCLLTARVDFTTLPATAIPPAAPRGLLLGSHLKDWHPQNLNTATRDGFHQPHSWLNYPTTFKVQDSHTATELGSLQSWGSHLIWAPMSPSRITPLKSFHRASSQSLCDTSKFMSSEHIALIDRFAHFLTVSPPPPQTVGSQRTLAVIHGCSRSQHTALSTQHSERCRAQSR